MLNPLKLNQKSTKNQAINLGNINGRKASVTFGGVEQSSLGGLPMIDRCKGCMDFLRGFSSQIVDTREASKVQHTIYEMVTSSVGLIACGYEDRNDITKLKEDQVLKSFSNTLDTGKGLPSQPTLSRFERSVTRQDCYNLAWFFVTHFVKSYKEKPKRIVIDVDDSNFDVHGAQQLSLFNGYYGEYCYMPVFLFEAQTKKLILPLLRPGRHNKNINIFGLLRRLFEYLHQEWPHTIIELRGDAHFCNYQFMDWARDKRYIRFTTGLTPNDTVVKHIESHLKEAMRRHIKEPKLKDTWYIPFKHKMSSWEHEQQIVAKIEIDPLGVSTRYIATNKMLYEDYSARRAFAYYQGRGRCELNIKNFKEIHGGRMSCHTFTANTFRLFLYAAAYVVLHTLKEDVETHIKRASKPGVVRMGMSFHNFIYDVMRSPVIIKVNKTTIQFVFGESCYAREIMEMYYSTLVA